MTQHHTLFAPAALLATLALAACGAPTPEEGDAVTPDPPAATPSPTPAASAPTPAPVPGKWDMVSSGEGDGLFFGAAEGEAAQIHLFCANEGTALGSGLLVNVPAFTPVASEERMTFGSGGTVVTLVADPAGDTQRGGVSGAGPVPTNLAAILAGSGLAANYGSQNAGPLPAVPGQMAAAFVRGCND